MGREEGEAVGRPAGHSPKNKMTKIRDLISAMLPFLLVLLFFQHTKSVDIEFYLDTIDVVKSWGYPIEVHHTVTDDGFILELHRIPCGRQCRPSTVSRPVIFLQHGFLCSSFDWVANLPSQSAAFVFADAGFDVWMGNFRGNTYSRKHVSMNPDRERKFWDWSWDEIAQFDISAQVKKALEVSNQSSLCYVGHSLGTLTMFTKLSTDPTFSRYIKKYFALAPVASLKHVRGIFSFLGRHFGYNYQNYVTKYGADEFFSNSWIFRKIVKYTCGLFDTLEELCSDITMLFVGTASDNWNQTRLPVYLAHTPAGSSNNLVVHFDQMFAYGGIPAFDMGEERNLMKYGHKLPPQYNFTTITGVPIYLFWSEEDWLSTRQDLEETLFAQLNSSVFQGSYKIHNYNHLHFIWGTNAVSEVYNPIVDIINRHDDSSC